MAYLKSAFVRTLQTTAERFGLTVLRSEHRHAFPQADYLRRLFREFKITGVIDIGANAGQYRDFIRNGVRFAGPIVSAEPIPKLASEISVRAQQDGNWKTEEIALGAEPGSSAFLVTVGSQMSSFLNPLDSAKETFQGHARVQESIDVRIDTLDALVDRHAAFLGKRIYLKMDTQGFDLEVLKGLRSRADVIHALQSEASVRAIYKGMPSYVETIQAIEKMGFTLSQIFPNNDGFFPVLIEFDCHFVRLPS